MGFHHEFVFPLILEAPSYPYSQSLAIDKSYIARTLSNAFVSALDVVSATCLRSKNLSTTIPLQLMYLQISTVEYMIK